MRLLSVDIGYGHTKVVFKDKKKIRKIKFPTAINFYHENGLDLSDEVEFVEMEGQKYLVGEDAVIDAIDTRDESFIIKYAPVIVTHAIKLTGMKLQDFDIISTGISVLNHKVKKDLETRLKSFIVDGQHVRFKKVIVSWQGQGVIYAENLQDKNVVIVDGGYNTLDAIPFNKSKLIVKGAYADKSGVSLIVRDLKEMIQAKTGEEFSMVEVNEALKIGSIKVYGEEVDLSKEINVAIDNYVEKLKAKIRANLTEYIKRSDAVVIAGGLSYLLKDSAQMPKNTIYAKSGEYGNALGYFKIAGGEL